MSRSHPGIDPASERRSALAPHPFHEPPSSLPFAGVCRMFAICCGYEDADDLDHLRSDPGRTLGGIEVRAPPPGKCAASRPRRASFELVGQSPSLSCRASVRSQRV